MRNKLLPNSGLFPNLSMLTISMVVGIVQMSNIVDIQPAIAQRSSSRNISQQVYERIPDLPRENQYISRDNGKVVTDNTLVSRMIRYHYYQKGRAPNYRFDWKLTLADYLGANELMYDNSYPGHDSLRTNPLAGDRKAIKKLTRNQRNLLVQTLVDLLGGS